MGSLIMGKTVWQEGPAVKLSLPGRNAEKYVTRNLADGTVLVFLPALGGVEASERHPIQSVVRAFGRAVWHEIDIIALSDFNVLIEEICAGEHEAHFVRTPLGETFSGCRVAAGAFAIGGIARAAIASLMMGDVLLVEGASGYAAIARRREPKASARALWR